MQHDTELIDEDKFFRKEILIAQYRQVHLTVALIRSKSGLDSTIISFGIKYLVCQTIGSCTDDMTYPFVTSYPQLIDSVQTG